MLIEIISSEVGAVVGSVGCIDEELVSCGISSSEVEEVIKLAPDINELESVL